MAKAPATVWLPGLCKPRSVDLGRTLAFDFSLRASEELHVFGDDLGSVAGHAILLELRVMKAALDGDQHSLLRILSDGLAEPVEAGDAVPFGVFDREALGVLKGLALAIAGRSAGPDAEGRDGRVVAAGAGLGIAAEVADEKDNVGAHDRVSGSVAGEFPDRLIPESGWGRALAPQGDSAAEALRETCKSRLARAGRAAPNTGRRLCGLRHERVQPQGVRACRTGDFSGRMDADYG